MIDNEAIAHESMNSDNPEIRLDVRTHDATTREDRILLCKKVVSHLSLDNALQGETVICLIDDQDDADMRGQRGRFIPLRGQGLRGLIPQYFWDSVMPLNQRSGEPECLCSCLVYVAGSTAKSEIGLTLTLAHELQHFIQYATNRSTWAANKLFSALGEQKHPAFRKSTDHPIEVEARIVAKRVAIEIHGKQNVTNHIENKIKEHITDEDAADWTFLLSIQADDQYDATKDTEKLKLQLRPELTDIQSAKDWSAWPEVMAIDLSGSGK